MFIIIGGDGKEYGPATAEQIRAWITAGRASLDTRAKALGSDEWRRLGDYAEFTTPETPPVLAGVPQLPSDVAPAAAFANASLGARFGGAFIDGVLKSLCWIPTLVAVQRAMSAEILAGNRPSFAWMMNTTNEALLKSLPLLAVLAIIQCTLLALRGQSVGKLLVGTRIVRQRDGAKAGFVQVVLLRSALPLAIQQIPLLGPLFWLVDVCFIFGDERRCVHDYMGGTKVVPAGLPPA
jgi:uncharacterized RDD family membrane protein YckC